MYDEEQLFQELLEEGYTPEDIEEYIREEVQKDKEKKYKELDKAKLLFFVFLLGGIGKEKFKEEIEKTIKRPNRNYGKVKEMINTINPKEPTNVFEKPKEKDIKDIMFEVTSKKEERAREKYIRILTNYYGKTQGTMKKYEIDKMEYLLNKVSKFDKIEKVVPYYDKNGNIVAYHDIASYNSMVYNTNLTNSVWNETLKNAINTENDLVYVPGHYGSCPYCTPYEDRIYSITGINTMYPKLQDAKDGGLKHPNCKHPIENYSSEVKTSPSVTTPPEVYNSLQKIRGLELKRERLRNDKTIYKELGSYEDVDKINQRIRRINRSIREEKSNLQIYE